jgi:hypothetical protein
MYLDSVQALMWGFIAAGALVVLMITLVSGASNVRGLDDTELREEARRWRSEEPPH